MKFQLRRPDDPDLNMTSLIDVVLLLLIFFMMSTRFVDESRLTIRLPEAGIEPKAAEMRDNVEIEVTAEGGYRVNGRALVNNSPDTLSVAVGRASEGNRGVPVTVRADRAQRISPSSPRWTWSAASATGRSTSPRSAMASRSTERTEQRMPEGALPTYRRLVGYLRPHRPAFAVGVLGMVLFAATDAGWAAFVRFFLDGTFVNKDPRMVWLVPIVLIVLFLLRGVGDFLQTYSPGFVGRHIVKTLRAQIFDRYLNLPISFFDSQASGVLLSRLTYNTEQVATATTDSITVFIRDTLTILGLVGYLLYLNWKLTALQPRGRPLIAFLIQRINLLFRRYSRRIQNSMGDVTRVAKEAIRRRAWSASSMPRTTRRGCSSRSASTTAART